MPSALPYGVFGEIRVLYFYPVPVFSTVLVLLFQKKLAIRTGSVHWPETLDP